MKKFVEGRIEEFNLHKHLFDRDGKLIRLFGSSNKFVKTVTECVEAMSERVDEFRAFGTENGRIIIQ